MEVWDQGAACSGSDESRLLCYRLVIVSSHGGKKARELPRVPFIRTLIPFMRAPSPWPTYFPKVPPSNTITLEVKSSKIWILGGHYIRPIALMVTTEIAVATGSRFLLCPGKEGRRGKMTFFLFASQDFSKGRSFFKKTNRLPFNIIAHAQANNLIYSYSDSS